MIAEIFVGLAVGGAIALAIKHGLNESIGSASLPKSKKDQKILHFAEVNGARCLSMVPPDGVSEEEIRSSSYVTNCMEIELRYWIKFVTEELKKENAETVEHRMWVRMEAKDVLERLQNYHLGRVDILKDLLKESLTYLEDDILEANSRIVRYNSNNHKTEVYK